MENYKGAYVCRTDYRCDLPMIGWQYSIKRASETHSVDIGGLSCVLEKRSC